MGKIAHCLRDFRVNTLALVYHLLTYVSSANSAGVTCFSKALLK